MWLCCRISINHLAATTAFVFTDEREWDAFVSYRSLPRDESFVVHQLYPKLETEMGFKLNLHFRDFIPGDSKYNIRNEISINGQNYLYIIRCSVCLSLSLSLSVSLCLSLSLSLLCTCMPSSLLVPFLGK